VTGRIVIVGLGPGSDGMITPDAQAAIDAATDIVGYIPYVRRITPRDGLTLYETDNRVEMERAAHALLTVTAWLLSALAIRASLLWRLRCLRRWRRDRPRGAI